MSKIVGGGVWLLCTIQDRTVNGLFSDIQCHKSIPLVMQLCHRHSLRTARDEGQSMTRIFKIISSRNR